MIYTKKCIRCSKVFYKRPNCSLKEWPNKKYCSRFCCDTSKKETGRCSGKNGGNWKGGINFDGHYYRITIFNHPFKNKLNEIYLHRYIMEQHLGRYLLPEERIHHINRDKTDNRIENLFLYPDDSSHKKGDWKQFGKNYRRQRQVFH